MRKQIAKALSFWQVQRGEGKILLDSAKKVQTKTGHCRSNALLSLVIAREKQLSRKLVETEALLETIDTSAGIHQLLLAGVEGMALRADIHSKFLLGRAGFKRLTAHAANDALAVVGMDLFLHCDFTSFAYAMISLFSRRNHCIIFAGGLQAFFL